MKNRRKLFLAILVIAGFIMSACGGLFNSSSDSSSASNGAITVTPSAVTLARGETQQFTSDVGSSWGDPLTWSLEGSTGSSSINGSGLLTVGMDETAGTLTVTASKSYYNSGTARVTIVSPSQTPSGLKVSRPGPQRIELSWSALSGVSQYTVQRSTNGTSFGQIGTASGTSYTDTTVAEGGSYYYRIQANGVNSPVVYAFAEDYFSMPALGQRKLIPLISAGKHYYRFAVNAGNEYTIEWQNGNNQNTANYLRVYAYQNNGAVIFSDARYGYTEPRKFTATATGFVTIEVQNREGNSQDYQIYCYGLDGAADNGTVSLPPYKVSAFRASTPNSSSITLSWDSVSDASKYTLYRSNTQTGTLSRIGESYGTSYTDDQVSTGVSYWYTIAAVNADGREGCRFQGAFGFATSHYTLLRYNDAQTLSLAASGKHYYRLAVTQGDSYTIEWQNGNNQNTANYLRVYAYQNNGSSIFSDARYGYTEPRVFTATDTGFVTIEVQNRESSSQNYQIYYY